MRKRFITTVWIIAWVFMVSAFFIGEAYFGKPPVERGNPASMENYVVQTFKQALAEKKLGCAAVALVHTGRITAEYGFGIASPETHSPVNTRETLFLLSSLSKAVSSWGIMKLVEEKKIGLDEPILPHLKRWRFPGSESFREKVTVRHLLSHTAGFQDGYGHSGFAPGEKMQTIEGSLLMPADANTGAPHPAVIVTEPGTVMSYSSAGYAVLQLLIEEISGMPFSDFMQQEVLDPLGMTNSTYSLDSIIARGNINKLAANYDMEMNTHPHRQYTNMAGVSLRSTVHDLAKLVLAYYHRNPVAGKASLKAFASPQPGTASGWGLGHTLYGENNSGGYVIGHGGGAFPASGADMRVNPATGNGIVILATGTQGLISDIADVWTWWETGQKKVDIRNVVNKRWIHAVVLILSGVTGIVLLRKRI